MDEIDREQANHPSFGNGLTPRGCCKHVFRGSGKLNCRITYTYSRSKCVEGLNDCEEWEKR
jgi:hypothetical protein